MNSKLLKKACSKDYENFFLNNSKILSIPFTFNRATAWEFYEVTGIKGKLPLRLYIWSKVRQWPTSFWKIKFYDHEEKKFKTYSLTQTISYHPILQEYVNRECKIKNIEINILSEVPFTFWLDFENILSLALSSFLDYVNWKIFTKNLDFDFFSNKLINKKWLNLITKSSRLCKKINSQPSCFTQIASLFKSKFPIVCFNTSEKESIKNVVHLTKPINYIDETITSVSFFPVDYQIIYTWIPITKSETSKMCEWLIAIDEINKMKEKINSKFKKNTQLPSEQKFENTMNSLSNHVNINALFWLLMLFKNPGDQSEIQKYISILWKRRSLGYVATKYSTNFSKAANIFMQWYLKNFWQISFVPHTKSLKGGCVTVVTEYNRARNNLAKYLKKLQESFPSACCLFRSREDEYDERGLVIEHDIENGIISDMLDPNLHIYSRPDGSYITGSFHGILENPEVDVAFDVGDGKIYVNGEKTTSKEILSQTAIVELMAYMIENKKRTIMNTDLPRSSFTRNKNTLNAKIINPLKKLIRQKSWKELYLSSSGSLTQFEISLSPSDVSIGIMKRVRPPKR